MTISDALEKANRMNLLYDFYAPLLTDKQQKYLQYYFHENYSLAEIAGQFHISRQAVYEHIRRSEVALEEYELHLKLLANFEKRTDYLQQMEQVVETLGEEEQVAQLKAMIRKLKQC